MGNRSPFRRLLSVEVLGGAVFGAALPYIVALAIRVAPTRVPLGLVALSVIGGGLLGWVLLRSMASHQRKVRDARGLREREDRERREQVDRLERLERAVAEINPRRTIWPTRRRRPPAARP